ncbi:hypothetical protein GQ457_08G008540 [Hibiscus cannabinus]
MAENEEHALLKHIDARIHSLLNDEQLKAYLDSRPQELKTVNIQKNKPKGSKLVPFSHVPKITIIKLVLIQVQKIVKPKPSTCSGIMASVWKFHKEDDDDDEEVNRGINHTIPASG